MFIWNKNKKPILALAPMADYTDSPFSVMCKKGGADLIYREMVSADALVHNSEKTLAMADFDKLERPIILQIFGSEPGIMARAASILEKKYKPDGIDINMGCPARKIVSDFNGASLMKDSKRAVAIIKAVKKVIKAPLSVKTRLGWDKESEILKFAPIIERAGIEALSIHGRTKHQGYSGQANWDMIGRVKKKLKIPVLVNGDIVDVASFYRAMVVTNADGALIARGALGKPWIFNNIKNGNDEVPKNIKKIILDHAKLHIKEYGDRGIITLRKHLINYVKGMPDAKALREKLVKVESLKELESILRF